MFPLSLPRGETVACQPLVPCSFLHRLQKNSQQMQEHSGRVLCRISGAVPLPTSFIYFTTRIVLSCGSSDFVFAIPYQSVDASG
jgi:hypothetical protein